jgi:hypothetical protein
MISKPKPHWTNPWPDAVPVPLLELARCHSGLGKLCGNVDGQRSFILTVDHILSQWRQYGDKLDAYILPAPSGWHNIGVRFGNDESEYLSPAGDKERVAALLAHYAPDHIDPPQMKLYEVASKIEKLRTECLFDVDSDDFSDRASQYFLLALSALEQAKIWAKMANDEMQGKSTSENT